MISVSVDERGHARCVGWSAVRENREARDRMFRIIEFVQKTTSFYNKRYLDSLAKS